MKHLQQLVVCLALVKMRNVRPTDQLTDKLGQCIRDRRKRSFTLFLYPSQLFQSEVVVESNIINEYIDEAWPQTGVSLLPPLSQPFQRSQARLWVDYVDKKMVPPFVKLMLKQDESEQVEVTENLLATLKTLTDAMHSEGPFFMGDSLGMVDIALVPFSLRLFILKKYRGFDIPKEEAEWQRFLHWRDACETHPSVQETMQNISRDGLCAHYEKLVKNPSSSQVASAVNANKPLP